MGVCQKASVGLNGITGKPVAAVGVEQALVGKRLNDQSIQEAAAKAAEGLEPLGDIFASAVYRAHLARVYTKRALAKANVEPPAAIVRVGDLAQELGVDVPRDQRRERPGVGERIAAQERARHCPGPSEHRSRTLR